MRLKVSLKLHNPIHIDYRLGIVALLKNAFCEFDPAYYRKLYEGGQKSKPFTFGVYLKNFEIQGDRIKAEEANVTISSFDPFCVAALQNGLMKIKEFNYRGNIFTVQNISCLPNKKIQSEWILCRTLSPLIVEDKEKRPVRVGTQDFEKELNYFANLIMQEFAGRNLIKPVRFVPIIIKEVAIKELSSKAGRYVVLIGYKGNFVLNGHPADIQFLYDGGLGRRRSMGFGLFDVVSV